MSDATEKDREHRREWQDFDAYLAELHAQDATIAELRKENERLSASLKLIAQMGGLTLLGPSDGDYDGLTNRLPDQYWAHELGAARAFSQAAGVAKEALKEHGTL